MVFPVLSDPNSVVQTYDRHSKSQKSCNKSYLSPEQLQKALEEVQKQKIDSKSIRDVKTKYTKAVEALKKTLEIATQEHIRRKEELPQEMILARAMLDEENETAAAPSRKVVSLSLFDAHNKEEEQGRTLIVQQSIDTPAHLEDPIAQTAYVGMQGTIKFIQEDLGRNSIDGLGHPMVGTINSGVDMANAYWDGQEMHFGSGDEVVFDNFAKSKDVTGHEIGHGYTQFTGKGLNYEDQAGAINESISDIIGVCTLHKIEETKVLDAHWKLGKDVLIQKGNSDYAIRDMLRPGKAYINHRYLGTDPQPDSMAGYKPLPANQDNGGVHLYSGIPNKAFALFAIALAEMGIEGAEYSWKVAGPLWLKAQPLLSPTASFNDLANATIKVAQDFDKEKGTGTRVADALRKAWRTVEVPFGDKPAPEPKQDPKTDPIPPPKPNDKPPIYVFEDVDIVYDPTFRMAYDGTGRVYYPVNKIFRNGGNVVIQIGRAFNDIVSSSSS